MNLVFEKCSRFRIGKQNRRNSTYLELLHLLFDHLHISANRSLASLLRLSFLQSLFYILDDLLQSLQLALCLLQVTLSAVGSLTDASPSLVQVVQLKDAQKEQML